MTLQELNKRSKQGITSEEMEQAINQLLCLINPNNIIYEEELI